MLFSSKPPAFVCDFGKQATLLARVSSFTPPLTIEAIFEVASGDPTALKQAQLSITQKSAKKASAFMNAFCGVSSDKGFIRRASLDLKRMAEPAYLNEVISSQFRIDPDQHQIAVLNPFNGGDFDAAKAGGEKEVCFCGLPTEELTSIQAGLLKSGVFPESIELSSVASLGALVDYLRFTESAKPTIVLEIGADSTQSFIVSSRGLEASRPIGVGLEAMVPVVQKELGLKDEESARKLFFSNTFDFTGMGPSLCKRLLKELQSSMGFYEVQTGQSIGHLICTVLPPKLAWLDAVIASQIGVSVLRPDFGPWLAARKITLGTTLSLEQLDSRKLALLGLIIRSPVQSNAVAA